MTCPICFGRGAYEDARPSWTQIDEHVGYLDVYLVTVPCECKKEAAPVDKTEAA